jgi:hypothetical protein
MNDEGMYIIHFNLNFSIELKERADVLEGQGSYCNTLQAYLYELMKILLEARASLEADLSCQSHSTGHVSKIELEQLVSVVSRILDTMRLVKHYGLKTMHELGFNWLDIESWSHVRYHQFRHH